MEENFSEENYDNMIRRLFVRFPSFQKVGAGAYKPGIANMEFFDQLNGHPHRKYRTVHVAGTNGKGSVCSMIASVLASSGLKVGLYTSPHLIDFRERMKIIRMPSGNVGGDVACGDWVSCISRREVWDFVIRWHDTFDHLDLSFFEITTALALDWFARQEVDVAVIETGLGGRLDSTNIISPVLSVITNIGLDHCDMLGDTLAEIAFEKAGIIKPGVPAVVGESNPETDPVFERKVLYSNLSSPEYMGDRTRIMSLLTYADKKTPSGWEGKEGILDSMDLTGEYQEKNLRTALSAIDVLRTVLPALPPLTAGYAAAASAFADMAPEAIAAAIERTAAVTGFHGRWETLSSEPWIICDIGHNAHGLKYNFHQLSRMLSDGECSSLVIVYGTVADKDYEAVFPMIPEKAVLLFTNASGKRACPAELLKEKYLSFCRTAGRNADGVHVYGTVAEAVNAALELSAGARAAMPSSKPLIYIGGSTYVVSEAVPLLAPGTYLAPDARCPKE